MVEDFHIKAPGAAGDFQSDLPQADDAEGGAVDILPQPVGGMELDLPAAAAYPAFAFGGAAGGAEEEGEGEVGGGARQDAGGVAHGDAAPGGGGYIHIVQADGQLADGAQAGGGVQQGGVHLIHNGGQDALDGGGAGVQLGNGGRGFVGPHGDIGYLADDVQGSGQQGAGDENLGARHTG